MDLIPKAIEDYALRCTTPVDALLDELRDVTYATMPNPSMQVGPVEGRLLRMLAQLAGARRALEIGMFTGYSALLIASALPEGGKLVTCEVDPKAEEIARRFFARSPHGRKIEIRMGPALETLPQLAPPFDFVFLDADKESYPAYYDAILPLLRPGALLVADNSLWSGEVLDPSDEESRAIARFNAQAAADPRVEAVMLTVRDGVTLVRKR